MNSFDRNLKRELNDIRFEFAIGRDSADGIASELVAAGSFAPFGFLLTTDPVTSSLLGLVDGRDLVVIAANLQKILDGQPNVNNVTFALVTLPFSSIQLRILLN